MSRSHEIGPVTIFDFRGLGELHSNTYIKVNGLNIFFS